ncbi:hypothetical protein C8R47DRAFT_1216085 [Mycena vitilis]|nr:hypothetical protein C8R47DRAFT_1216085 [Mycena vitilis]
MSSTTTTTILIAYEQKTPPAHPPDASGSAPRITPTRATQLAGEVRGMVEALPKGAKGALILTGADDFCEAEDCKIRFQRTYNILGIERELAGLAYKFLGNLDVRPHELLSAAAGSKEDRSKFHDGILKSTPDSTLVGLFRDFLPEHQTVHQISASRLRDILSPTTFVAGNRAVHDITFQDAFFFLRSLRTSYVDDDAERADVWETVIAAVTDTPYGEAWQEDDTQLKAAAERARSERLKRNAVDEKKGRRAKQFYARAKKFEDERKTAAHRAAVTGLRSAGYIPGGELQKLRYELQATNDTVERLERTVDRLLWFVAGFPQFFCATRLCLQGLPVHGHASEAILPLRSFSTPSAGTSSSSCSTGRGSSVYKGAEGVVLASPSPQVPLAILLNDNADQEHEDRSHVDNARPRAFYNIRVPVSYAFMYPDISRPVTEEELEDDADAIQEGFMAREKKHGCTMCHKRFDRPSTLKKHLLVHTGEKAFQCTICERRFGVMSNLNRHIRRCSLREVHTHGSAASTLSASPSETASPVVTGKRGRTPPGTTSSDGTSASPPAPTPRKRRRRPPSPSRWIPASLRSFNILAPEVQPAAKVPLDPVSPRRARQAHSRIESDTTDGPQWDEERDSWDENVGRTPYHPSDWEKTHRLPGPACVVKFGGALGGNYSGDSDPGYEGVSLVQSRAVRV